jgi:hypothetical protein
MPCSPLVLPNEVLALCITCTEDTDTLLVLSLVSRLFHLLVFPLIHHTVSFKQAWRIKAFTETVKSEEENSLLRISQALRWLIFDSELNESSPLSGTPIDKDLIVEFRSIIPKLIKLEHLRWGVEFYHGSTALFPDFQHWCPQLRSLEIFVQSESIYTSGEV